MDALKFFEEAKRLCKYEFDKTGCHKCPMYDYPCGAYLRCGDVLLSEMVSVVEKWSAEHPVKTRLMDFTEKHPKAKLVEGTGLPFMYPHQLGYCETSDCARCEHHIYTLWHCWNLPMEE